MVEDADKSFLNDIIKEEEDEEDDANNDTVGEDADGHKMGTEQLKRDKQLEEKVAEAVDEILEEARIKTSKRPAPAKKQKSLDKSKEKPESKFEPAKVAPAKPEPPKSAPEPPKAIPKSDKPMRSGPPAVPPPPPPIQTAPSIDDDNKFEANFEANFDDAFGESDPEPEPEPESQKITRPDLPKQLGGRASIPDELGWHWFAYF